MVSNDALRRRAMSFGQVREANIDVSGYNWDAVPEGEWEAFLDFKVWGKSSSLGCFFTSIADGKKYKLNAFPDSEQKSNTYSAKDGGMDMSAPGLDGKKFLVEVRKNTKGNLVWQSAKLLA
ncbi:hypothetical protein [Herbaspirillum robiniae]|uniref:hypothetical protein n=1 Tax=Herbaspirillum robiniae TaxID=2014887 RepID=UPI00101AE38A|nr:hypothetical protein [Herbaspirillum robiniae]